MTVTHTSKSTTMIQVRNETGLTLGDLFQFVNDAYDAGWQDPDVISDGAVRGIYLCSVETEEK